MLTTTQVAARLGVSVRQVQNLIAAARLPATRLGRDWLIEEAALTRFVPRKAGRPPKIAAH